MCKMENKTIQINYKSCAMSELSKEDADLVAAAQKATYTSYAPYSNFSVGAAVKLSNSRIKAGINHENAVFGAGICHERCTRF